MIIMITFKIIEISKESWDFSKKYLAILRCHPSILSEGNGGHPQNFLKNLQNSEIANPKILESNLKKHDPKVEAHSEKHFQNFWKYF